MAPFFTGITRGVGGSGFGNMVRRIRIPNIIQVTVQIAGAGGSSGGVQSGGSGGLTNATITVPDVHVFQLYVASNSSPSPANYVQGGTVGNPGGGGSALLLTNSEAYSNPNYLLIGAGGGGGGVSVPGVTYSAGSGGGGDNPGTPPPSNWGVGGTGDSSATSGQNSQGSGQNRGPEAAAYGGSGGGGFGGGGGGGGGFSSNQDSPSYWYLSGGAGGGGNIVTGIVPGVSGAPVSVTLSSASTAANPNSPGYCTFTTPSKVTPYSNAGVYSVPVASLI